jgi:(E)-4-hydroxy-3-methylbut-2-enyl-diphosphate synthase
LNSEKDKKTYISREIRIGNLKVGGKNPVLIQTMTNTPTSDTGATVSQIIRVVNKGCDIVRVAVPDMKSASNLGNIKKALKRSGIDIPLVADVHYSAAIAETSARLVEKVRINPGNFIREKEKQNYTDRYFELAREQMSENIQPLLKVCKEYGTALRIGVNWGSLSKKTLYRYGNTPRGMAASAMEFMDILLGSGFENFTLSLKASDVKIMQEANVLLVKEMIEREMFFPLHLGVTEAGADMPARVKSAVGIGSLLKLGIGDTIRVSLTENPENEIPVAKKVVRFSGTRRGATLKELDDLKFSPQPFDQTIAKYFGNKKALIAGNAELTIKNGKALITETKTPLPEKSLMISHLKSESRLEDFLIESSIHFGFDFLKKGVNTIYLENDHLSDSELKTVALEILQALGLRYSKAEYIACPSCGRSRFNVIEQLKRVKEKTVHLKRVKIAVMGCPVNGPGEMADADFGYTGTGKGKVTIYENGKPVRKNIPEENAPDVLLEVIEEKYGNGKK